MLRDLIRTKNGRSNAERFVKGQIGIRNLINQTNSERVRTELYRLERQGVSVARNTIKQALKNAS